MKRLLLLVTVITALVFPINNVFAQQQSGQGLEISPVLIDQKVDPGQTIEIKIKLRNITSNNLIAKGKINDFKANGEEGLPLVITDEDAEPSPYSFQEWVKTISDTTLEPKQQKTLTITIDVPKDASPGGHYGVVRFTAVPEELKDNGVSLAASIGTLVLLDVSGDAKVGASVEEFSISQDKHKGTFFEYGPLDFLARIKNTGNVHFQPTGTITLTDTFGKQVGQLKVNDKKANVLPDSIRRFEQRYDKRNMFGRYTAQLKLNYADGKKLNASIIFWVLPYKVILAVLAVIILLIVLILLAIKRFKKHVVEEVQHEQAVEEHQQPHDEKKQEETVVAPAAPGEVVHPTSEPQPEESDSQPAAMPEDHKEETAEPEAIAATANDETKQVSITDEAPAEEETPPVKNAKKIAVNDQDAESSEAETDDSSSADK